MTPEATEVQRVRFRDFDRAVREAGERALTADDLEAEIARLKLEQANP